MCRRTTLISSFRLQISSQPQKGVRFGVRNSQALTSNQSKKLSTTRPSTPHRYRPLVTCNPPARISPKTARHLATMAPSNARDRDILPDNVKPVNYDISLYDLEFGGTFTYQGTVSILSKIVKSSKEITLNSHQLKIHSAEVSLEHTKTQQSFKSTGISYDTVKQRVTITFADDLPVSDKALVAIKFQGTMNNDMAGFYRSKYKPTTTPAASVAKDDEWHYMFSTQFESCDARRAFPCFDEPNLKATFDFEIELPVDQVALSNMQEKAVKKGKEGFQVVSFERTPIMSTYLLAWAVGDFEYIEDFTKRKYNGKPLPVRVYTTRGLKSQAQYALEHAPQVIDYFSEIFDIDYPLPKSDLLAVHEFVSCLHSIVAQVPCYSDWTQIGLLKLLVDRFPSCIIYALQVIHHMPGHLLII
jgi:aminopeptidase N